jgi:cold shock CspA family protein
MRGEVKTWVDSKGYGFIASNDGGCDLFVRCSKLLGGIDCLTVGDKVSFDAVRQPDGRVRVVEVELVD